MMWRKFGTKWELCGHRIGLQNRQGVSFEKGAAMPTFEVMMYYVPLALGHLKFHYDQGNCVWVDVDSIMSNVTMEYDPIMNIPLIMYMLRT